MFGAIKNKFKLFLLKRNWRKKNRHNNTVLCNMTDIDLLSVGKRSYGQLNVINHSSSYRLSLGNYCSIAPEVLFVVCGGHAMNHLSTFPFKAHCLSGGYEAISKGDIVIEDDVWIGTRAIILSGVHIGKGAIVAAGAVVTSDIPEYSIVAGVPAKVVKKRFTDKQIELIRRIDYDNLDDELIRNNIENLYKDIKEDDNLEWIPQDLMIK